LLFLVGLILRISLISKGPYHADTMGLVIAAERTLETGVLQRQSPTGYPLTMIFASMAIYIARLFSVTNAALAVNYVSVLFSALAVVSFYYLIQEILAYDNTIAVNGYSQKQINILSLIGSILFSVSPIFLGLSVYGKSHIPCMFFLLQGILFLFIYFRKNKRSHYILSAVCLGLMGAARIHDLVLMSVSLCFLFFMLYPGRDPSVSNMNTGHTTLIRTKIKSAAIFSVVTISTIFFFYAPYFFQGEIGFYPRGISEYLTFVLTDNFMGLFSIHLPKALGYLVRNFTLPGFLLSIGGYFLLIVKNKKLFFFLLLWAVCPLFYYGNLYMTLTSRYFVLILPPFIIASVFIVIRLLRQAGFVRYITYLFLFVVSCTMFIRIYPNLKVRHDEALTPRFAQWVKSVTRKDARVIQADGAVFISYYGHRQPMRRPTRPLHSNTVGMDELAAFKRQIDTLLKQNIPVYISSVGLYTYDYEKHFSDYMKANYELKFIGSHPYEGWHGGAMSQNIVLVDLYRIEKMRKKGSFDTKDEILEH
ncbi:MAG: DUF2723 domain-containing protein, partial [Candidatus Omnitrophica bacterium]|nr:DUF2723 domain-containing protein [Candidatus Omnitrophota bacterium]